MSDRRNASDRAASDAVRFVRLGYVAGTHGLRGDVRVKQHNEASELLFDLAEVVLRRDADLAVYELASVRGAGKGLLVHFVGVDSIEAADDLRGAELCVARSGLPELEAGEYYHVDLEGLAAYDSSGVQVGVVERVCEYPASRVLRVRGEHGVWEVPMIEPYLLSVDVQGGRIVVDRLEDLDIERGS